MSVVWHREGPRVETVVWLYDEQGEPLGGAVAETHLGDLDLAALGELVRLPERFLGDALVHAPECEVCVVPDEPELAALVMNRDGILALIERPANLLAPPTDRCRRRLLPDGTNEVALRVAWGRHLSVRAGWRLLMAEAFDQRGQVVSAPLAPGLAGVALHLDADDHAAHLRAGCAPLRDLTAALPDPHALGISEPSGMLTLSDDPRGGYRSWAGPYASAIDARALWVCALCDFSPLPAAAAAALARRGLDLVVDDAGIEGQIGEVPVHVSWGGVVSMAAHLGVSPAEALVVVLGERADEAERVTRGAARIRELLPEAHVRVDAVDAVHVTQGERSAEVNMTSILAKCGGHADSEDFTNHLRVLTQPFLTDDPGSSTPLGWLSAGHWYTRHLRPLDALPDQQLALPETTTDALGREFLMAAVAEDDAHLAFLLEATLADLGGAAQVRRCLRRDRGRIRITAQAHRIDGVTGPAGVVLEGPNIATALAQPGLRTQLAHACARRLPGDAVAVALTTHIVAVFIDDGAPLVMAAAAELRTRMGPAAGAELGFVIPLTSEAPSRGHLHLHWD